ncbi:MAG: MazG nucleotide pyrophosphohydrolase domain-containing protein [Candidatus Helarchaeota archaeon]
MKISEFQNMMKDLYFERDRKRGVPKTFCWFIEEVGELARSINKKELDFSQEFADIFAWLCSLANLYNVDLEKVSIEKYNFKCPKCENKPCNCKFD